MLTLEPTSLLTKLPMKKPLRRNTNSDEVTGYVSATNSKNVGDFVVEKTYFLDHIQNIHPYPSGCSQVSNELHNSFHELSIQRVLLFYACPCTVYVFFFFSFYVKKYIAVEIFESQANAVGNPLGHIRPMLLSMIITFTCKQARDCILISL